MHTCGKCKCGAHCEVRMRLDAVENREAGRSEERAAIVAWLRADSGGIISGDASENLADAIERGDYRRGKP